MAEISIGLGEAGGGRGEGEPRGFSAMPYVMTPRELAEFTGELESSIRRGIAKGRIPADKVNGRWRILRDVVFANAAREVRRGEDELL